MLLSTAGFYTMRKLRQSGPRFLSLLLVYIQTWKCKGRPNLLFSKIEKPLKIGLIRDKALYEKFLRWSLFTTNFSKNVLSCAYLNFLNCPWYAYTLKVAYSQVFQVHVCSYLPKDVQKKLSWAHKKKMLRIVFGTFSGRLEPKWKFFWRRGHVKIFVIVLVLNFESIFCDLNASVSLVN